MMLQYVSSHAQIIALIAFGFFARVRVKSYLHLFQQDEYDNLRFLKWIGRTASFDRTASVVVLLVWLLALSFPQLSQFIWALSVALTLLGVSAFERRHQKTAKKPVVMTNRARRTFEIAWIATLGVGVALVAWKDTPAIWLLAVHSCPFLLVAANLLLGPFEKRMQAKFWREAHEKLQRLGPFVVGITGSYGKTSVKHILGHLLQFHDPTLITPGSVNTAMGISRIVREQLRPSHKFFVAEMGAYGPGSIKALCQLAPPKLGILTAIGSAHLERFGSKQTTARAKMELASAVIANGGRMILNAEVAELPAVAEQLAKERSRFIMCGEGPNDVSVHGVLQTQRGLEFRISSDGKEQEVSVPLFGRHQALNVALAFAAAKELGLDTKDIVGALKTVPQISHRLEVRRQPNGALIIDDGYNSNPAGFASALELLGTLKKPGGSAILVTPGIVELGRDHAEEHFRLGQLAAKAADKVFVIGAGRIPTFLNGLRSAPGSACGIGQFDTFHAAQQALLAGLQPDDVVLIENDLPDIYERKMFL